MVYLGNSVEKVMYLGAKRELFAFAREMRKTPTESENILWKSLKPFRKEGFIFRRQHPIDIFIADFYCHKLKLVIEVDGEIHSSEESKEYDDGRTAELEKHGIRVIRFSNTDITDNLDITITEIANIITELTSPSLPGEGDQRG
jgi:very-short-patch-repair endonuclease